MTAKITLKNDYHNTKATVIPQLITDGRFKGLHKVSRATHLKVCRDLCGVDGCMCGGAFNHRSGHIAVINEDSRRNLIVDINECHSAE